jgi:hypothetical protein
MVEKPKTPLAGELVKDSQSAGYFDWNGSGSLCSEFRLIA